MPQNFRAECDEIDEYTLLGFCARCPWCKGHNDDSIQKVSMKLPLHLMYLFCAAVIAGCGLIIDSGAVVVASMIISSMLDPIKGSMTAISGIAFGIGNKETDEAIRHVYRLLLHVILIIVDIAICIVIGLGIGYIGGADTECLIEKLSGVSYDKVGNDNLIFVSQEISSRGKDIGLAISFFIAFGSAIALTFADKKGNKQALVGIGISASLLPPAVNCGILFALYTMDKVQVDYLQPTLITNGNSSFIQNIPVAASEDFLVSAIVSLTLTFINVLVLIGVWSLMHIIRRMFIGDDSCIKISDVCGDKQGKNANNDEVDNDGKDVRILYRRHAPYNLLM